MRSDPAQTPEETALLLRYAGGALEILENNLRLYQDGSQAAYRVVAAQLRLLLCDTTRIRGIIVDISLAAKLWPLLALHPVRLDFGCTLGFDTTLPALPRLEWLAQELELPESESFTLREAIRWVCDRDGGVHVDPRPEPIPPCLPDWIVSMGEYVLTQLTPLVQDSSNT